MPILRYKGEADNNGACIAHQDKHHAQVHKARVRPEFRPWSGRHRDGVAAVKVQYPGALAVMLQDLANIRIAAAFLQVCMASNAPARCNSVTERLFVHSTLCLRIL